jgi:hypothetical protein
MRGLSEIVALNAKAAGRAAAHADNDGKDREASNIVKAQDPNAPLAERIAFNEGYAQGQNEG